MRIGISADYGGFHLKRQLVTDFETLGYEVVDFGAHDLTPDDDYPNFVVPMAKAGAREDAERGKRALMVPNVFTGTWER